MKKLRIGVAIAIAACLLLAAVGVAAANHWGLFDFINRVSNVSILPEATDLVATDIVQQGGETEYATFTLREAVYDGRQAYMLFEVKPKEGILLLGVDSDPAYSMQDLTREESDLTIGEYAAANNLKMIYTNIGVGFDEVSMDFHMEDDGTLTYGIQGPVSEADAQQLAMNVRCITYPAGSTDFEKDMREANLTFSLQKAASLAAGKSAGTADFPGCGVRVDSIEVNATAMGLYCRLRYTVVDKAAFDALDRGLWFEFLDESGEPMAGGAAAGGSVIESEGGYIEESSLAAVKEIPASLTLRAYNCWTKERYETVEIPITPNN